MTQLNWKRPLALAAALFILGMGAYWLEYSHKPKSEEKQEQSKKLFKLKDFQVADLKVVAGGKAYAFHCLDLETKLCKPGDNSKWEVTQPLKIKADDTNVNSLLSAINNVTSSESIDLKEEAPEKRQALLKEYKLDKDSRSNPNTKRVEVTNAKGESQIAYFGDVHPIGESIFVTTGTGVKDAAPGVNENNVLLVPNYFKVNFERDLNYWRNKKLFTIAAHQVRSFDFEGPKGKVSAERKDGNWQLQTLVKGKKDQVTGDIENIDNLLTSVTYLAGKEVASEKKDDAKAKNTLRGSKRVLNFVFNVDPADKKAAVAPITFSVFEKKTGKVSKVFATVSNLDPLFELDPTTKDRIDKDPKDLRLTKLITSMDRFTARKITFESAAIGPKPLILNNQDGKWLNEDKSPVESEKVQNMLDRLSGNRIKEFLEGKAIPAGEQGGLKLTLADEKNSVKRHLVFWKTGDKLYARDLNSGRKEAFLVDSAIKDALPWEPGFFTKTEPKKEAQKK